jgi:hypothetical protein
LKSEKQSKITNGKQQLDEQPVFFLDRTFGRNELADMLRLTKEFVLTTIYEEYGEAESKIADPVVILDCGFKNRVLLTGDQDLIYTWAKEIAEAKIAVFVTTNNNEGPKQWGPRIISARRDIMRELRRRKKPFTARISTKGRITQVRIYDSGQWKTITIGKKNPPHINRQKQVNPESA